MPREATLRLKAAESLGLELPEQSATLKGVFCGSTIKDVCGARASAAAPAKLGMERDAVGTFSWTPASLKEPVERQQVAQRLTRALSAQAGPGNAKGRRFCM